jgi:DNA-directed RNA polymerase subunit RPC12/RpoP
MQTPQAGDEKDCERCGHPAIFETRPLKPSVQPFQVGDYVPPAAEYQAGPGWTCTVCRHFEPLTQ